MRVIALMILAVLLFAGCTVEKTNNPPSNTGAAETSQPTAPTAPTPSSTVTSAPMPSPESAEVIVRRQGDAVLKALKEQDWSGLSKWIDPLNGLLFSPYVHLDTENNMVYQSSNLPTFEDIKVHNWGIQDGSGEPIELTFQQYYEKFIYDQDFINAKEIGFDEILGTGNMYANIKEIYPNSVLLDYHFPGFDPKLEGMDWESLILVFESDDGTWYLRAIVHSQWTI